MSQTPKPEAGKPERVKEAQNYQMEIQAMMYACGDVRTPDKASSMYLEQLVHVQMKVILEKAYEVSRVRGTKQIGIEELVFVLRKNPCRVKKLSSYIVFKEVRNKVNKEVVTLGASKERKLKYSWLPKRIYENIEQLKDRMSLIDRMTENMSKEEYLDFTECRQASFTFRKTKRFREFLNTEYKIKDEVIDALGFIAYEIVFDIISLAGEISTKKHNLKEEPLYSDSIFGKEARKIPISKSDIDETCRRLKEKKVLF
ncbi:transcription initiation protein SPT3 [Nematocida sp. LUAm3]|nr:transcription initiation protein SPT3 [Nematocida sp. LUAm3]KAI5173773.1 transcription initiation protein SPT3 [Nematocida sp. LUAm2]KAI5176996.1 transcription initiation protein SPT3 [Nematocida sp. LUAm1]